MYAIRSYYVWSDGTYIYAPKANEGLKALSFNGTTLTSLDLDSQGGNYYSVWGDGTYIYVAVGSGIRAYTSRRRRPRARGAARARGARLVV